MTWKSGWLLWVLQVSCALVVLFGLIYPIYVVRPFRPQRAGELSAALTVMSWAPGLSVLAAIGAITCALLLWRRPAPGLARVLTTAIAFVSVAGAALTRVNVFELMFHRIEAPASVSAAEAKLDPDDMVLAITVQGQSRAYPVRMLAYHHIVNDVLDGVAIAATY